MMDHQCVNQREESMTPLVKRNYSRLWPLIWTKQVQATTTCLDWLEQKLCWVIKLICLVLACARRPRCHGSKDVMLILKDSHLREPQGTHPNQTSHFPILSSALVTKNGSRFQKVSQLCTSRYHTNTRPLNPVYWLQTRAITFTTI